MVRNRSRQILQSKNFLRAKLHWRAISDLFWTNPTWNWPMTKNLFGRLQSHLRTKSLNKHHAMLWAASKGFYRPHNSRQISWGFLLVGFCCNLLHSCIVLIYFIFQIHLLAVLLVPSVFKILVIQAHVFLDSRPSNWSCFSAHSWTNSSSSSLPNLSWAFLFSADEDLRREEVEVDAGIELSSLNWGDSGNESVLVVEGDGLGFPRSLNM